jgi:GNAT superfamily N-acetyltransferase
MTTVADCERVQREWFAARGRAWTDGPLTVTDGEGGLNIMFPAVLEPGAVRRVADLGRERGLSLVGAWLGADVDASALAAEGFERGWEPWWMTAPITAIGPTDDPRITVSRRPVGWRARAREGAVEPAGAAWAHLRGSFAGVFDMCVRRELWRRGLGSALLRAVCAAAASAGAEQAVLNGTPMGKLLYTSRGFVQIGVGITWWLHLAE